MVQVLSRVGGPLVRVRPPSAPRGGVIVVGGGVVVLGGRGLRPRGGGRRPSPEGRQSDWQREGQGRRAELRRLHGRHRPQVVQPQGHAHIHAVTHLGRGALLPPSPPAAAADADARLPALPQAAPAVPVLGVGRVWVVGRVQEVALVLLGGGRLVKQQLGVCWVLTPTSTITAWPHPHLLLGGSLVGEREREVRCMLGNVDPDPVWAVCSGVLPEGWSSRSLNVSQQSCSSGCCSGSCGCHWKNHWSHLQGERRELKSHRHPFLSDRDQYL